MAEFFCVEACSLLVSGSEPELLLLVVGAVEDASGVAPACGFSVSVSPENGRCPWSSGNCAAGPAALSSNRCKAGSFARRPRPEVRFFANG